MNSPGPPPPSPRRPAAPPVKPSDSRFSSTLRTIGKATAFGLAGLAVVAGKALFDSIQAAEESIKIGKQTDAVIKSTGGSAKVTAGDIGTLVDRLSKKASVDDELIQSGANVLLTFTRVRNEVGAGNDIFDRATGLALDMSVALGTDLQSANIQLGKALNDPIKGITALQRVGVTFTQQQKDQIATLVASGDTLGAQKIILQELTTEFGGSAEAQATASDKMKVAFGNLQEEIGTRLLPLVEAFSTWMTEKGIPKISEFAGWVSDTLLPALGNIKVWIEENVIPPLESMWTVLNEQVIPVLQSVADVIEDTLVPAFGFLVDSIKGSNDEAKNTGPSWQGWVVAVGVVGGVVAAILGKLGLLVPAIKGIVGIIGVIFVTAWQNILNVLPFAHILVLVAIFRTRIVDLLQKAWDAITGLFTRGREFVAAKWNEMWTQMSADVRRWWAGVSAFFAQVWSSISNFFTSGAGSGGPVLARHVESGAVDHPGWRRLVDQRLVGRLEHRQDHYR